MNRMNLNINTVNAADDLKATLEAKIAEKGSTPRKFKDWAGYNINNLDYELTEFGNFPNESDYLSVEFMEMYYLEGRRNQRLDSDGFKDADNYKDREQIEKMLLRFINAVVSYGGENND